MQRRSLLALIIISALLLAACSSTATVKVTHEGKTTTAKPASETVSLESLLPATLQDPEEHVYTLVGDKESTITYEELQAGKLSTTDNSLVFETIMCECADIKGLRSIIIEKKSVVVKDDEEHVVKGEVKTYIENYLTSTPESYAYLIDGKSVPFEMLTGHPLIEMQLPQGSLELKLAGDNPTAAYAATLGDAIDAFTPTPEAYTYYLDGEAIDPSSSSGVAGRSVELRRNTMTIKDGEKVSTVKLSTTIDAELEDFITVEGKEGLEYRLTSAEGFSPPPLSWEEFKGGLWLVDEQATSFPAVTSKKYSIRDLTAIEIVTPETAGTAEAIMIADLLGNVEQTEYEGEAAVSLAAFLKDVEGPENYLYRLTAADGYSPEHYTYEDLQQGYWLLKSKHTLFPHMDIGKNRIRDLETITPVPKA